MLSKRSGSLFVVTSNAPKITKNKKVVGPQNKVGKKMENGKSKNTWRLVPINQTLTDHGHHLPHQRNEN
jgi:hypothetical protein